MKKLLAACFGTTKKAILSSVCIAAAAAAIGGGAAYAATTSGSSAPTSVIGDELAQNYALADAGVDPAAAENLTTKYEEEDGQFFYDVEFTADDTEYEYWVSASDGTIIRKSADIIALSTGDAAAEDEATAAEEETATTESNATTAESDTAAEEETDETAETTASSDEAATTEISIEDAKEIALADAGTAEADVTFTKAKQDREDGVYVYDVEFYTTSAEYEYEIRVSDGAILNRSVEKHETTSTSSDSSAGNSSSGIGVAEAKQIALNKAGLSASEVTFKKAMKEKDDGITVYEIEFYKGTTEYECTINASTGAILEYDVDVDD